jgi:hypothetical protein
MFDSTATIVINARTPEGSKQLEVRWPTDAEWASRMKARKILIKNLGRGIRETVPPDPGQADVALYQTIAINGAPSLTPAEASRILEAIGTCDVTGVTLEGEEAVVDLRVVSGEVHHRLKLPSTDQILAWRRAAARVLDLQYGVQEIRVTAEPGARLWDACGGRSEDYQGAVPAIHKDAAVRSVVDFIEREFAPKADDASF